jgi:hypothetical protein
MKALHEYNNALNNVGTKDYGTLVPNFVPPSWAKPGGPSASMGPIAPMLTEMPKLTDPFASYGFNPATGAPSQSVEITVNTGVGDPEAIARAVEDILNQSTYRGTSVARGSGVYAV